MPNYLNFYDTKPKPQAGAYYKVPKGAWLDTISIAAYGYNRVSDIIQANSFLTERPVYRGDQAAQLPYIHPGDMLFLPASESQIKDPDTIPFEKPNEVAIRIDGTIFRGWTTNSITRNIDKCADSFVFSAPFDPNSEAAKYIWPFTYKKTDLFIGGKLYISGIAMKHTPSPSSSGVTMTVEVRSRAGETVDCMSMDKNLDYNKMTLKQIADKILKPFGIETEFPHGDTAPFIQANRQITDTIFGFLSGLARQKGLLVTSTTNGNMSFQQANIDAEPVAALIQQKYPLINVSASYDSIKRHSHITAVSQSAGNANIKALIQDESIPAYRPLIITANEAEAGNIKDTALWKRSRAIADSAPTSAAVFGWKDEKGDDWIENSVVTVYYPLACIMVESRYLITNVSLTKDENGGDMANLGLALPQAFSKEFPEVLPWDI